MTNSHDRALTPEASDRVADRIIADAMAYSDPPANCPRCSDAHHFVRSAPMSAEPENNAGAFRGGWLCDACGWVVEDEEPAEADDGIPLEEDRL